MHVDEAVLRREGLQLLDQLLPLGLVEALDPQQEGGTDVQHLAPRFGMNVHEGVVNPSAKFCCARRKHPIEQDRIDFVEEALTRA